MKKLIAIIAVIALVSCTGKQPQHEYDPVPATLIDTPVVQANDKYYQSINSPTRKTSVELTIRNTGDTAKRFIVKIQEL